MSVLPLSVLSDPKLPQVRVKQRQPILKRLQRKTAKDQPDAKRPNPPLRNVFRIMFKIRVERLTQARNGRVPIPCTDPQAPNHQFVGPNAFPYIGETVQFVWIRISYARILKINLVLTPY